MLDKKLLLLRAASNPIVVGFLAAFVLTILYILLQRGEKAQYYPLKFFMYAFPLLVVIAYGYDYALFANLKEDDVLIKEY